MFDEQFEVVLADNESARSLHYQVRYHVYCLETDYENPKRFPEGEERDRWDERAAHFLVRHRPTGAWIAAMRLILPATSSLPVLRLTGLEARSSSAAEISRMCVIGQYRRRGPEPLYPYEIVLNGSGNRRHRQAITGKQDHQPDRRRGPDIMAGLLRAGVAYSIKNGISEWYFLTTGTLTRVLRQMGITPTLAGKACNYRGERYPYLIKTSDIASQITISPLFQRLFHTDRPAYRTYSELQLAQKIRPQPMLLHTAAG